MSKGEEKRLVEEVIAFGGLCIQIWEEDLQHALEGHPEVTIDRVRGALRYPLKVIQSKTNNRVCLFYSLVFRDEASGEDLYLCVVVGVLGAGKGKLETAYESTYIKTGKVLLERGEK